MTQDSTEPITDEVPRKVPPMLELGVTGLRRSVGTVDEEFLPNLRGRTGVATFREMRENDPIVGALVFAIDRLLRQVEWKVSPPGSDTPEGRHMAEFVEECKDDMSHTWDEFISEAITMVVYGWSFHEIVYKRRMGPGQEDPSMRSKYRDGMIGIRKMPIRAQETLLRWVFDESGGIKAMVQLAPPLYKTAVIPIQKGLLFRTLAVKNNPEGYSMLRNAYRPWFYKKRAEEQEMIGIERDLAGLPVVKLPRQYLAASPDSDEGKLVDAMRIMVRNLRRNEQEGLLFPTQIDEITKLDDFSFELMGGGGTRQFSTDPVIRRYSEQILQSVLADFIALGTNGGTGSYAMHTDKTGLFRASINSISQSIADVLNRHMLPRLFKLNGFDLAEIPQFEPSNIDPPDLGQLASLISALGASGMSFFPDGDLEDFVRDAARLPLLSDKDKRNRDLEQQQTDLLRMARQQLDLIGVQGDAMQQASALRTTAETGQPPQPQQPGPEQPGPGPSSPPGPGQPGPQPVEAPVGEAGQGSGVAGQPAGTPATGSLERQQGFGKRLDPVHQERWERLKANPTLNAAGATIEDYPQGTPLGMLGRAKRRQRLLRERLRGAGQQPPTQPRILRRTNDQGGQS